jgi:exopolyphosphatase/pppGpp-phosphohydrolase
MGFAGALAMLNGKAGRYATLDLGGGSFQLAIGSERGMEAGGSTQVGSNVILDTLVAPRADADGKGDPAVFADVDAKLKAMAAMPLDVDELRGRTLVATGGVSKFLRAHFGKDVIERADIEKLRRDVEGAVDYGKKLPASSSLLLHILDGIGVDEVRVSETDSRHALINARVAERD